MSNLETDPAELLCEDGAAAGVEILDYREVPLGGPRAMPVRRTLPQRARSLIGAWCFVDHYGPDDVVRGHGMVVPPHPHTGLQTVSWLFAGEIEHRDSVGSHAMVRPGELNLMTAGSGIAHSEVSTANTTILHGAQLWLALPDGSRHRAPSFEHYVPEPITWSGAEVRVFIGSLLGQTSSVAVFSPLVGAQLDLPSGTELELPVDASFEHGVLVDTGEITLEGVRIERAQLGFAPAGRSTLRLRAGEGGARILLIGGAPFGESIVMWWNFIGRSHEEIVEFRRAWQTEVIARTDDDGRFGLVRGYEGAPLPAPELPAVRLRPRD